LTWCRDAISCAAASVAVPELARVTKAGGWVVLHTTCATKRLAEDERVWLYRVLGLAEDSMDRALLEQAGASAGLDLISHVRGENQSLQARLERAVAGPSELLTVARLTEFRPHYVAHWGEEWFERILAWETWALYLALGKLEDHSWLYRRR
jgi:hypothetical protein